MRLLALGLTLGFAAVAPFTGCTPFGAAGPGPADAAEPDGPQLPGASPGGDGGAAGEDSGVAPPFRDCRALLQARPTTPSGVQRLGDDGSDFDAYCNMTTEGGGWTLVGRSGEGSADAFGWSSRYGTVGDRGLYSLGVIGRGLEFIQILVARGSNPEAPEAAYVLDVPQGFPSGFSTKAGAITKITLSSNLSCSVLPGMFGYLGHTALDEGFFFRDKPDTDTAVLYGLRPAGWSLNYDTCESGLFHNRPGMIFVR